MASSKQNLATRNRQLVRAISEFANMEDTPDRWRAFQKRWPTLLPQELYVDSEREIRQNVESAQNPINSDWAPTRIVLEDFGVSHREFRPTEDGKWVDYKEPEILRLRNLLRDAWRGGPNANQSIEELLGLWSPSGEIHDMSSPTFTADWRRGSLRFVPRNELQAACYALLLHSNLAKLCANPDCPAPYFVARRATQRYCSPDCLKPFQKQSKLDWWNRKGKVRRAKSTKARKRS